MPQLFPDILREVFHEIIVEEDKSFKNIEKFMLAGKQPFQLVLNYCKKANSVVFYSDKVAAKMPGIKYQQNLVLQNVYDFDWVYKKLAVKKPILGTEISTSMKLFKPISIALASKITSLDIRSFSNALIPMLKSIDQEMKEIYVPCDNFKAICKACVDIPNVQNGVTVKAKFCDGDKFCGEMRSFVFPCQKLTITEVNFNEIHNRVIKNSYLHNNIRNLTIEGKLCKHISFSESLQGFATFLTKSFSNLETLNVTFLDINGYFGLWNWNDDSMANIFQQQLSPGVNGCITFITKSLNEIDQIKYPNVQRNGREYYKIFPINDNLNFKMIQKIKGPNLNDYFFDFNDTRVIVPYENISPYDEKPKRTSFDRKNIPTKSAPVFKNQRSYKPARNRFAR